MPHSCTQQKRHRLSPILLMPLVGLLASQTACNRTSTEKNEDVVRPVRTAVVSATPESVARTYPASVLPSQQAELAFKVAGQIIELPARASQSVKQGDVIAQLDQREFQSVVNRLESQLEQARLQLAVMKSGERNEVVATIEAKLKSAEAQVAKQRTAVNRYQRLLAQRAVAPSEVDDELAKLASDEANVDVARLELKMATEGERAELVEVQEAEVRGLEAQLLQAKTDLEDSTLRAPFDGVIARRNVENFDNVMTNDVVVLIQKLDRIDVQFDVPGNEVAIYGQIHGTIDNKVRLDVAPGRLFDAQPVEFNTEADAATQTFRGRLSIETPEDVTVLPGMTGSVILYSPMAQQEGFAVPESALGAEPDGSSFVWVVSQTNSATKRKVNALKLSGDLAYIDGEVQEGDVIVTAGVSFLREGMTVRPLGNGAE